MKTTQFTKCLLVILLASQMCTLGCHRGYYRRQADNEAQQLVAEKSNDPRWNSADGRIDIDPQSRMFDPFSADHPPIPPDDPASHQFMYRVDGKDGFPHWHANGDTDFVENPEWRSYLPVNKDGKVVIDLETAFELAKLHSTDFQRQRENLYLSALDVSLERFGFDSQLFSGFNSFFSTQGRLRGAGSATSVTNSLGSNGQGVNLERLGTTGANFAVGLANTIMWNFAGPNTQSATTLIDFSVIQPLLRNAGRDRIMESLTLAERTLLADVRQLDRFRRGFYLEVIMGRNAGNGPGANFLSTPGFANGGAGGYLGLLQDQQNIRIQEFNVRHWRMFWISSGNSTTPIASTLCFFFSSKIHFTMHKTIFWQPKSTIKTRWMISSGCLVYHRDWKSSLTIRSSANLSSSATKSTSVKSRSTA